MIKKRNRKFSAFCLLLVLFLASCSSMGESTSEKASEGGSSSIAMKKDRSETKKSDTQKQKMIYTSQVTITVQNFKKARSDVEQLANKMGGYIVESETLSEEGGHSGGYLKVRIPQDRFFAFTRKAGALSTGSPEEVINGRDVTEEYTDLEAQLKAKRLVRARLENFMKNAEKTEDLLHISKELAGVQEQIEKIQGRMNFLNNQSELSTVTVHFEVKNEGTYNKQLNTWAKAKALLKETWNGMLHAVSYLIIALIGLSPVIILLAAIAGVWVYSKRKKRAKKETKP